MCVSGWNAPGPRSCGDPSRGETEKERDRGRREKKRGMRGDKKGALCAVLGTQQVQKERKMWGEIEILNL